jgi:hypothetical protein
MGNETRWLIVTPTLGVSPYLNGAIESIKHLQGHVEHIIVCPESAVVSIESLLVGKKSKVISEKGYVISGMYSAINLGITNSERDYDFFCYLNDDDYFLPAVSNVSEYLTCKDHCIYYSKTSMVNSKGTELYCAPYTRFVKLIPMLLKKRIVPFMQPSLIIPKSVLLLLNKFDDKYKYCSDLDFILRAVALKIPFIFIDQTSNAFRIHGGQLSSFEKKMTTEKSEIYSKHFCCSDKYTRLSILKLIFTILNISIYIKRFKNTKSITSNHIFYG